MSAFRAGYCLAGMAVLNLYGISAFIAVKNHPASSTERKTTPPAQRKTKLAGQRQHQLLHASSTITKKYFIYFDTGKSFAVKKNQIG
jgi:hypothetical protein